MSLGLAGNRPGFRIREDAKASDSIRENVQGKPSRIPHEESSELFEIEKEREQFEGKARRDARKQENWAGTRLELAVPTFKPRIPKRGILPRTNTDVSSRSQKISEFNWMK